MNKKSNNGAGKLNGGEVASEARQGLRLVPGAESDMNRRVPDDDLRDLLKTFKRSGKTHRHSSDDDLLPAA